MASHNIQILTDNSCSDSEPIVGRVYRWRKHSDALYMVVTVRDRSLCDGELYSLVRLSNGVRFSKRLRTLEEMRTYLTQCEGTELHRFRGTISMEIK